MRYDYGLWVLVVFHVVLFLSFGLGYLRPKKRREWRSLGIYSAFIVALYTEMYGFPLTIYLLGAALGRFPFADPFGHGSGNLWATLFLGPWAAGVMMALGGIVIIAGVVLLAAGWRAIHGSGGELVVDGIYGMMRHPQYSGIGLIILGSLIQWPTLPTLLMGPILLFSYYRLARREEEELEKQFGDLYRTYKLKIPAFVPRLGNHLSEDWS